MLGCIQPMSSPMMKRMLGFCCCWATAGVFTTSTATMEASRPSQVYLAMLTLPYCWLPVSGRQPLPYQTARSLVFSKCPALDSNDTAYHRTSRPIHDIHVRIL